MNWYSIQVVNCGNWGCLYSIDKEINKYVSDLLNNSSEEYYTYSSDNGDLFDRSRSTHTKSHTLKTPDELQRMKRGEIVVVRKL